MPPQFRNPIDFIADGVEACWRQSSVLCKDAASLLAAGSYSLALSISILAMEEIGKLLLIDGLLFARANDDRSQAFKRGFRSHQAKLAALDLFPFLVNYFSTMDPRREIDSRFSLTLAITLQNYQQERHALGRWIGAESDLTLLDEWKQRGIYTHLGNSGQIVSPKDAISADFAQAVHALAQRFSTTMDFLLKDNIQRYRTFLADVRQKLTDVERAEMATVAEELVQQIFGGSATPAPSTQIR